MHFPSLAVAVLLAVPAVSQVVIPPHSSIYNGYTRGFNFTSGVAFGVTQLSLPMDAFQAGDTASYVVRVNGANVYRSVGNAGAVFPNIVIKVGDVVDILGNWSPAAPGSFTAHNSYTASVAPYATMIEGIPHNLNRTGWQYDIGSASWLSGSYLAPGSGQMGRVFLYTAPAAAYATYSAYGTGCAGLVLDASARPVVNTSFNLTTTGIPMSSSSGVALIGGTQYNPGIDLTIIGMTGCSMYTDVALSIPFAIASGSGSAAVPVPNNPALNGVHVYAETVAIAPGSNSLGLVASNGLDLRLGTQ